MSRLRLAAMVGLIVTVLLVPGAADARSPQKTPSVTARVSSAQQQLRKLPKSTWAKGRRAAVLRQIGQGEPGREAGRTARPQPGSTARGTRC